MSSLSVTLGIIWPKGRFLPFLDCFPNGIVRSNLNFDGHSQKNHYTQHPLQADQIRSRILHSRPHYAVLAQPQMSLNASAYRPSYAVFGGHFMPRVTARAPGERADRAERYNEQLEALYKQRIQELQGEVQVYQSLESAVYSIAQRQLEKQPD